MGVVACFANMRWRIEDVSVKPRVQRSSVAFKIVCSLSHIALVGCTERIVYCQHVGEAGERLFQAADQLGLEGVIGNRADSPYRAGRTLNWVKVKTAHGRHVVRPRARSTRPAQHATV